VSGFLSPAGATVLLPLLAAAVLAALPQRPMATTLNVACAAATFALACSLPWQRGTRAPLLVDAPAALSAILVSLVAMTSAWCMAIDGETKGMRLRFSLFQALLAITMLALLSDDLVGAWMAMGAGLLVAVAAVGLPLTADSIGAAARYLILGSVGLALAMFGVVVLYLATPPSLLESSDLAQDKGAFEPDLLRLAFVLLVLGFGTLAGVAPMHGWVPAVTAAGAAPVSTMFIGATGLAPLLIILRLRHVLALYMDAHGPGVLLLTLGVASLLLGAFGAWHESEAKRAFAYAGIGQAGVVLFSFGLGSEAAIFAGVMVLTLNTLTRPALFMPAHCVRGARLTHVAAIAAVAGLPPFGLFAGWYLVFAAAVEQSAWLALPLGTGLVAFAVALIAKPFAASKAPTNNRARKAASVMALTPAWLHLAVGMLLGLAMPAFLARWFDLVAQALR
jgi:hydrogenase-4 component F